MGCFLGLKTAAGPRVPASSTVTYFDAIGAPEREAIDAKNSVRRRAAPNAIAAAPHQANTSAAAYRWRGPGNYGRLGSADRRQIALTARAGGRALVRGRARTPQA